MWIPIASLLGVVLLVVSGVALYTYLHFRGARFVKCPETHAITAVTVDAGDAALSAAIGNPQLHLSQCTRFEGTPTCDQECLRQIEFAGEDCLVRNVVSHWYKDRKCAVCGHAFGEILWHDHKPALLDRDGRTVQWSEVPLAELVDYLDTHQPVCWNCHIVQTFRHDHPELVTYRKER
jgi:hypothetical protein